MEHKQIMVASSVRSNWTESPLASRPKPEVPLSGPALQGGNTLAVAWDDKPANALVRGFSGEVVKVGYSSFQFSELLLDERSLLGGRSASRKKLFNRLTGSHCGIPLSPTLGR